LRIVEVLPYHYGAVFEPSHFVGLVMPSILEKKNLSAPSLFVPSAILREARRQKGLPTVNVPAVCILDPDGDLVRRLQRAG
jgi:hypothetical protein